MDPHKRLRPRLLVSSVISVPLQEQIEEELAVSDEVKARHPDLRQTHNAAVFLNGEFEGGVQGALEAARKLLPEAMQRAGSKSPSSIDAPLEAIGKTVALAQLEGATIRQLLGLDSGRNFPHAIERVWPTRFDVTIDINLQFRPLDSAS